MKDRLRLLPREFLSAWIATFGTLPPEEFLDTYETTCEALYWGHRTKEDWEAKPPKGKHFRANYFFADPSLLWVKAQVDRRLACIAAALQRWDAGRDAGGTRRPRRSGRVDGGPAQGEGRPAGHLLKEA